jgi:SAM-dependent methyltransferase
MRDDPSHGYDATADEFIRVRSRTSGLEVIKPWARAFSDRASVLDIGAGSGLPVTQALIAQGLEVLAIDASPKMVTKFQRNFPDVAVKCEAFQESRFFDRTFDGVIAVGLMFLLSETDQHSLIAKVSDALKAGGRFLFSAPHQICEWEDVLTGETSRSLGIDAYQSILADHNLHILKRYEDAGGTHYIEAQKSPA